MGSERKVLLAIGLEGGADDDDDVDPVEPHTVQLQKISEPRCENTKGVMSGCDNLSELQCVGKSNYALLSPSIRGK